MSKLKLLIPFLLFLMFASCTSRPVQYTTYTPGTVPFHRQATETLCFPTSLYMIADFYAQKIGWYDASFIQSTELATQTNINDYLLANGGTTWYPNSQTGAPFFLFFFPLWHLDTYTTDSAYLMTHTSGDTALSWQLQHFQNYGGPLIVMFEWADPARTKHAIVAYKIRYDNLNKKVNRIYYHDPYYGDEREKLPDDWKLTSYITPGYWLTIKISNIYKGAKNVK